MPDGQAGGQPVYILREGSTRSRGRDAQDYNIMAAMAVAEAVRSTLGPKGMDKMLVDSTGNTVVTNDGVTILKEMDIEHPAAKMVVEVAKTQDDEVGDGTTTAVVFSGELLKKARDLIDQEIHPTVIAAGYRMAANKVKEILEDIAIPVKKEDRGLLSRIALTAMTGKGAEAIGEKLSSLAVDAIFAVQENGVVDVDNINIEKKAGAGVLASEMVSGIALSKSRINDSMPRQVRDARILLINVPLEVKKTEVDAHIRITNPGQMKSFLAQEDRLLKRMVDAIQKSGANVVLCQKSVDDLVAGFLAKAGILAVKSISEKEMGRINKAVGGRIVTNLDDIDPSKDLGYAGLVDERRIGGEDTMLFIEKCKNPKAVSIILRGGSDTAIDELERAFHDALRVVGVTIEDKKVVPGGGAPEVELALRLREYSATVGGREQMAVQAFADSLNVIPRTLAENAGLDPIDMLVALRSKHETKDGKNFGLNVFVGKPEDMLKAGVIEPMRVKTQAINSAVDAAIMILRIDDVISSGGPSEQEVSEARAAAQRQMAAGRMGGMGGMGGMGF